MKWLRIRALTLIVAMGVMWCGTPAHASPVRVINRINQQELEIQTLDNLPGTYILVTDISKAITQRPPYVNQERQKIVLYIGDHRVKVSALTSFIIVDQRIYHMPTLAILREGEIYLPATAFFNILRTSIFPGMTYDPLKRVLYIDLLDFNVTGLSIEQKANGTILRLVTKKRFPDGYISAFLHNNGWFYLTIKDALVDTTEIRKTATRGVVERITSQQFEESAQLAFKLRSKIVGHEVFQSTDPPSIVVTLRTPYALSAERLRDVRDRWRLDTVILDAGHGGKDGGTVGRYKTKEKDISLDIVKRIGLSLERNTHIKVVYTRDEDVFVPLWKRTKIANESNGKLFVSIHLNSNPNRSVKGFETYLLRPGKTDDAIEVAARENAVIKLEESANKPYSDLTGENLIMATMAQSMFMKESEDLAAIIQEELAKQINTVNRGVKQAGFQVLVGASMPNVLIEAGFLSNPTEEKKLRQPAYRQRIATAIYYAILRFRESREQVLAEG